MNLNCKNEETDSINYSFPFQHSLPDIKNHQFKVYTLIACF